MYRSRLIDSTIVHAPPRGRETRGRSDATNELNVVSANRRAVISGRARVRLALDAIRFFRVESSILFNGKFSLPAFNASAR